MQKIVSTLLMAVVVLAAPAWAKVSVTDVQFNALPGGQVELQFIFDGTPPEPQVYAIESPARIALDLEGAGSGLDKRRHALDMGNAQSVMVVESGDRTRVVVNLLQLGQYETRVEDNKLVMLVGSEASGDYLQETASDVQKAASRDMVSEIRSIDFRRGDDGEGRLIVDLSNPNIDINSKVEGRSIKLSFVDAELPDELRLNYDVSDFATPVQSFKATQTDRGSVLEVVPTGQYDYLAYQTDNTYVLTIKPLTEEEVEAKKKEFEFVGDKLSLNFQNIEVRAVLQLIADFTDLNLVASDSVSGKITLRLENVPWDQALDLILKTKGLDKRVEGNVLMVAPAAEIARREKQEIESKKQQEDLAPLQTEFLRIRYAKASDIFSLLQGQGGGGAEASGTLLSSRATVVVDERTNSLLVTETGEKLEDIRRLINLIDVPVRQVMIEARIVNANASDAEKLGIAWGASGFHVGNDGSVNTVSSSNDLPVSAYNGNTTFEHGNIVDLGVSDFGATQLNLGFISANGQRLIDLQLSAIESSGNGEVVTQPKVITGDKQQAVIKNGTAIPYQESSPNGASTTAFEDAVLELDVTPSITPDDRIIMELNIKQDSVGQVYNGVPSIDTTEIETSVLVANGETVVLGGIFQTSETEAVVKTPFLGDIPYLGRLFRRTEKTYDKTEILVFITPRILSETLVQQ